jgi:large subunit ribosomal protein L32
MGVVPKQKKSKARCRSKRSHSSLTPPVLIICSQCSSPKPPYQACPICGTYKGREVVEVKSPKKKAE